MPRRKPRNGGHGGEVRKAGWSQWPSRRVEHKVCAECFRPRSMHSTSYYCNRCERMLFPNGYEAWVHAEKTRQGVLRAASARKLASP